MEFMVKTAVEAATSAGEYLLKNFKRHQVEIGGNDTLSVGNRGLSKEITSANDNVADRIIIDLISDRYPDHNLLTEETGLIDNGSPYTWIVDPLDGSSNFVNHNPFFAVSICLALENVPISGVIFSPYLQEIVVARHGHGCTLNGRPVRVSTTSRLDKSYIVSCPGGDPDNHRFARMGYTMLQTVKDFRMMGSAAIEAYMIAAGRADAFITLNISPWDVAAGVICVQEAGGSVTDLEGNPWQLDKSDLLMSNGLLHDAILSELGAAGISQSNPIMSETSVVRAL